MKVNQHVAKKLTKRLLWCLVFFTIYGLNTSTAQVKTKSATFTNPIGNGADPWVIQHNGYYYVCQSNGNIDSKGISVRKSKSLSKMGKPVTVWKTPSKGWNSSQVWAPELHHFNNKWYIYYAAGKAGPPYIHRRSGVLESVTDDPQGAYVDKGILNTGVDKQDETGTIWAIDVMLVLLAENFMPYGLVGKRMLPLIKLPNIFTLPK